MGKRGRSQKGNKSSKRRPRDKDFDPEDMDDEIDAFHKQRDVMPLDINGDVGDSDEDNEHPVFDFQDAEDADADDDDRDTGMATKIKRQLKFLQAKYGGVEDEMHDDEDAEDDEEKKTVWGGVKSQYYYGDNRDFEMQASDDESPAEEEAEVVRMMKERAKSLDMEDFGPQDATDSEEKSDREPTLEEIAIKQKSTTVPPTTKEVVDDLGTTYEEVRKDLNSLSREEQMDVM